ncbi:ligand-gated channel [Bacteroidia bacterium]|nr:ligand-gated channel [Bacteroidia bacterium]
MAKRLLFVIFSLFTVHCSLIKAQSDTSVVRQLEEVEVKASTPAFSFLSASPVQSLSADKLEKLNALLVSDAVKYFSGVQVKDYGGVGGLKTVSIRSLGANYTTVAYDGISLSDYQTGQIDLGRFSLDNVEQIGLTTGGDNDIFQPARNQALSGVIRITSRTFVPTETKRNEWHAGLKTGSWEMYNPSVAYSQALNRSFVLSASSEYLRSKGDYPYQLGQEHRKRNHSEVENWKSEINLKGTFQTGGKLAVKTVYFNSDRNIPGAAISGYNYVGENMRDRNLFSQANYTQAISNKWQFQANAKFNHSVMDYSSELYPHFDNRYDQQEYYLNAIALYKVSERLSFSWANDGIYGQFKNVKKNLTPARTTWLSALAGKYETSIFTANASLLNQYIHESTGKDRQHLSPYIGLSVKPLRNLPLRWRLYYKNTYRLPTFADIYYPNLPNTKLKPENAHQYNTGLTIVAAINEYIPYISLSSDVYYNRVENKIIARPISSLALLSVQNYDDVEIKGIDLNLTLQLRIAAGFSAEINGTYTYQEALNKGNGLLLAYTPRHSATGFASLKMSWLDVSYQFIYSGNRYYNETPRLEYLLKRYIDQGISLTKIVGWKDYRLHFSAECLNLLDVQYDVVRSYPMPGRSFRFGIKFNY